ncbi:WD40 repeat protein/transcriptional regulator with XRE-family HTH domain [Streptomyces umbrinus]|uniref:WD40 repeat protein/transcriptional regulator with XRE-family HTH domain n=1 Tax=Streptomyces umbrinus TaxID=67370 RepID=A0ABU0SX81_9ACTN|nr:PQQ-binding-like beta-propeller repeat protein [Streptomyces umbrinus]MDQ1027099.1 WD40 repeat protein/transcriptional regulator with XRE-family HTH domain [Streptomyces umbrinus]
MAGRREVPVDPAAGPAQRFAFELRKLRAEAAGITYRSLARRAGYSVTTLSQAAAGERLPTLPVTLAYVGACGGDLAEWEARWKEAVEESAGDGSRDDDGSLTPYRGLARFETGDSRLFFGREQLTADLVDLLRRRRFAAVFGPSGSGKSSLLRAGLIPALRQAQEPDLRPAAIRILTPGERPARSHASLLTPAAPRDGSSVADTFVIVDQFEEVFTLCHDAAERARFIDLLLTARKPESRLRVLLAVRGDFYGRCAEHRDLAEALRDANILAGGMSPTELRDAVVKPATAAGLTVERALTTRLVKEVADAPGGLPLLSHALLETWRRRRGKTLTMAGYEAAGCLDGAIAKTAEQVYGRFTEDQAATARRVLLRLVAPGDGAPDTRRPVERAELPGTGRDDTAQVVEALAGSRLLTLDGGTVEIAHEALITAWPRLREWIEENRERLRVHRNLTEAAHAWQELGREEGALCRGSRLAAAQEHFGGASHEDLNDLEHAFLDASRDHEQKGRRRYRLVLTAVTAALCLALVAAGLAVGQWQSAVTAQHLAQSRQLAAQSSALLDSEPDLASLLAVHAYRTSPTREATAALYAAAALPLRERLTGGTEPVDSIALSPDGHTVAANSRDGKVRIWSLPGGRLRHTIAGYDSGEVAAFSPDGRILAVADSGLVGLLDPVTGKKLRAITVPDGSVRGMAFSPDGRTLAISSPAAVRVWDAATGRLRHSFTSDPEAVAFGPDGRTVAAAGRNGRVQLWDLATGRARTAHNSRSKGASVAFSPDGRTYAMARTDGLVQLREVATGTVRRTISDGPLGLNEMVFAPDGRTLAILGQADTVQLWDTASGTAIATVAVGHHGRGAMKVALSANGRTLVTSSNSDPTIRVHRLYAERPQTTLPGPDSTYVADMTFGPDGRTMATIHQEPPGRGSVRLWDVRTGDREATPALDTDVTLRRKQSPTVSRLAAVGFSPTGHTLAALTIKNRVIKVRVAATGRLRQIRAVSGIEVRDVATGRLRQSLALRAVNEAVFSPDGTRLAFVGERETVQIWHLSTGALHTASTGHGGSVRAVEFTPDGRTLAVVNIETGGDQVTLLDAATGRTQRTIKPSRPSTLSLAFSPDGHTLATASSSGVVSTWDRRTGRLQDSFSASGEVASLAFSPDGRTLAAGTVRGVQLWDLATSQTRITLPTRSLTAVAFSPDGQTLAIGTGSSVGLWNVNLPDPARAIRNICEAVDASLTPLEQSRYLQDRSTETGCQPAAP